jgi:hypothetical protein
LFPFFFSVGLVFSIPCENDVNLPNLNPTKQCLKRGDESGGRVDERGQSVESGGRVDERGQSVESGGRVDERGQTSGTAQANKNKSWGQEGGGRWRGDQTNEKIWQFSDVK